MSVSFTAKRAAALCLAGSGACALVYQTAWLRALAPLVGDQGAALSVVLALFMGGGGIGGFLLGRRIDRAARPFLTYAVIELAVAAAAFASPWFLEHTAALAVLALALPVVLLGGTLPAAARVVTGEGDLGRKGLAALCGLHALGAVVGALVSALVLLDTLGAAASVRGAAVVHTVLALAIVGLAWRESRRANTASGNTATTLPTNAAALAPTLVPTTAATVTEPGSRDDSRGAWVLPVAFVTGFVFFLAEIGWSRATGHGASLGFVLAYALGGLALGGVAYAWAGPQHPAAAHLAITCALEAVCLLAPALLLAGQPVDGAAVALLVLPASLVAGWQYPMLLALKGRGAIGVSSDSGDVGAANTLGSILGALGGGFVFAGSELWALCGVGLVLLAFSAALAARRDRVRAHAAAVIGLFVVLALAALPARTAAVRDNVEVDGVAPSERTP